MHWDNGGGKVDGMHYVKPMKEWLPEDKQCSGKIDVMGLCFNQAQTSQNYASPRHPAPAPHPPLIAACRGLPPLPRALAARACGAQCAACAPVAEDVPPSSPSLVDFRRENQPGRVPQRVQRYVRARVCVRAPVAEDAVSHHAPSSHSLPPSPPLSRTRRRTVRRH